MSLSPFPFVRQMSWPRNAIHVEISLSWPNIPIVLAE